MREWLKRQIENLFASPTASRVFSLCVCWCHRLARAAPHAAQAHPMRILVIRLDRIGDLVLTSPLLRELRRSFPQAWITLVASQTVVSLAQGCPHVSETFFLEAKADGLRAKWRRWRENTRLAWNHLLARHYTHVLLPRYGVDHYMSYQLASLVRAPERIAFSIAAEPAKAKANRGWDSFPTRALSPVHSCHEVERSLLLLASLGHQAITRELELWLDSACRRRAVEITAPFAGLTLIGVCPSSHELERDWPFDRFIEIFAALSDANAVRFLVFGSPEQTWIGTLLERYSFPQVENLVGRVSLDEAAAVIGHCDLFLTVDTGLMHVAAAQKVPVVEISCQPEGSDPEHHHSPARFGPWMVAHRIVRLRRGSSATPGERLIAQVSTAEVLAAMRGLRPSLPSG